MKIERGIPVYRGIADELRKRIAKSLRPGDLLAPETQLACEFSVNHRTVRQALETLVDEGLIRRYRRRGTVVVDRNATGEFAIVVNPWLLRSDGSRYFGLTSTLIADYLSARNPHWITKLRVGRMTDAAQAHVAMDLVDPEVLKRLRGVFTFHNLHDIEPTLKAAGVPIVAVGRVAHRSIGYDYVPLYKLGLAHLREAGCRTFGVLRSVDEPALRAFCARTDRTGGLRCLGGWNVPPSAEFDPDAELYGYELFTRLWTQQTPHPEGILVEDDIVCRGVLRAITQLGIRVPRKLRVVTHAMTGIPIAFHTSVTRVEFDPAEQARQAVEMMTALIHGLKPNPAHVLLAGTLVKGETT